MDISPTYALVFSNLVPNSTQIINKFHVIKYIYDAVSEVRNKIRKDLNSKMNRFVANNHGIRDKDFSLYRIANYFKYHLKLFENRKFPFHFHLFTILL